MHFSLAFLCMCAEFQLHLMIIQFVDIVGLRRCIAAKRMKTNASSIFQLNNFKFMAWFAILFVPLKSKSFSGQMTSAPLFVARWTWLIAAITSIWPMMSNLDKSHRRPIIMRQYKRQSHGSLHLLRCSTSICLLSFFVVRIGHRLCTLSLSK